MRRWIALIACLLLLMGTASGEEIVLALAIEGGDPVLVGTDGIERTQRGEYSSIVDISSEGCPEGRRLFSAMQSRLERPAEQLSLALLNAKGERLTEHLYDTLEHIWRENVVVFQRGELAGAMDERGNVLFEGEYIDLIPADGGFLALPREGVILDEDGYPQLARLWHIASNGEATDTGIDTGPYFYARFSGDGPLPIIVRVGDAWKSGYLAAGGAFAIEPIYESADVFRDGLAIVGVEGERYGMIRPDGTWALPPIYTNIGDTYTGAPSIGAVRDQTVEILDRQSLKVLMRYPFPSGENGYVYTYEINAGAIALGFGDGMVVVGMDGEELFRLPNEAGAYVTGWFYNPEGIPERMVLTAGEWPAYRVYIVDRQLNRIAGPYQELAAARWSDGGGTFVTARYEMRTEGTGADAYASIDYDSYRYGLVDQDGNALLPEVYRQLWYMGNGYYMARDADLYGIIDEGGNWLYQASDYEKLMD